MAIRYLSLPQVAERIGVSRRTIQDYAKTILPAEDGRIGTLPVWLPQTIDRWNKLRPGKNPTAEQADWQAKLAERPVIVYLAGPQFAERCRLSRYTIDRYRARGRLPPPDAIAGRLDGWLPQSVDAWNARRPGKRPSREEADWHLPPEYHAAPEDRG